MDTLIIVIAFLAILHFIYDGIILTSIRLYLRNRLFVLRDELRSLRIHNGDGMDAGAFLLVHEGINNLLNRLHQLTITLKFHFEQTIEYDHELQERIKKRIVAIDECGDEEIKRIFSKANQVVEMAFVANAGGWFIYLIPIALLILSIKKLSQLASELVVIPSTEANRLLMDN